VISNQYALSRSIRPPAGLAQEFFVSLPAGPAPYGPAGTAASFDIGRNYPRSGDPRCTRTLVGAKSADVLSQTPNPTSRGLAPQRFSPYLFSKPRAWGATGLLFSYAEFSNSTQEVSEWRCHRHEYRSDL
jgi:hypothetical protein